MIRVDVISKSDAVRRIAKGLPAYGIVWCWDEIVAVDLLNDAMRNAFFGRFDGSSDGIYYASGFREMDESIPVDLAPGKCILHKANTLLCQPIKSLTSGFGMGPGVTSSL